MTAIEIKAEIQIILNELPEDALIDVLNYVTSIQNISMNKIRSDKNFQKIITEDHELLKRLAQ